jgi:hypothetical protein
MTRSLDKGNQSKRDSYGSSVGLVPTNAPVVTDNRWRQADFSRVVAFSLLFGGRFPGRIRMRNEGRTLLGSKNPYRSRSDSPSREDKCSPPVLQLVSIPFPPR